MVLRSDAQFCSEGKCSAIHVGDNTITANLPSNGHIMAYSSGKCLQWRAVHFLTNTSGLGGPAVNRVNVTCLAGNPIACREETYQFCSRNSITKIRRYILALVLGGNRITWSLFKQGLVFFREKNYTAELYWSSMRMCYVLTRYLSFLSGHTTILFLLI